METWKDCYGYEDQIQVSNKGRVRSFDRYVPSGNGRRFVKSIIYSLGNDKDGYKLINIPNSGNAKTERVHRLVLLTFSYSEDHRSLTVNHIDGVKDNNNIENLEWATPAENTAHAIERGLIEVKGRETHEHTCLICCNRFRTYTKESAYCSLECSRKARRVTKRPSKEELLEGITSMPMTHVGDNYGVSDNAVRKWCKAYGLPYRAKDIKKLKLK